MDDLITKSNFDCLLFPQSSFSRFPPFLRLFRFFYAPPVSFLGWAAGYCGVYFSVGVSFFYGSSEGLGFAGSFWGSTFVSFLAAPLLLFEELPLPQIHLQRQLAVKYRTTRLFKTVGTKIQKMTRSPITFGPTFGPK